MSKAITLPVNVLVIVAIAIIVLLGLIAIYGVGFNPFSSAINLESVKNEACRKIVFSRCEKNAADITVDFDANRDGTTDSSDTFLILCQNFFWRNDELSCKQLCGCTGATTSGPGPGPGPCTCDWIPNPGTHIGDCFVGLPGCWPICNCNPPGCGLANNIRCTFGPNQYPEGTVGSLVNGICITAGCPP